MSNLIQWCRTRWASLAALSAALMLAVVVAEPAGATATYDIAPVTTGVTDELVANLPIILGVIGALIALAVGVRAVRKFVKV
jgi:cell division protein FtsX